MATHFKGTRKETNSLDSYIKLLRAADSVNSRVNLNLTKNGLTQSQFNVLDALFHLGPLSQSDLAKKIFKSGGNITMVIDNLEKQELVERERKKSDRRFFTIYITKKGRILFEKIFPQQLEAIVKEFSVLSEKEMFEFQRLCKIIGKKINKDKK